MKCDERLVIYYAMRCECRRTRRSIFYTTFRLVVRVVCDLKVNLRHRIGRRDDKSYQFFIHFLFPHPTPRRRIVT